MDTSAEQDASEKRPVADRPLPRRRRHGRVGMSMVLTLVMAGLILTVAFLSLSGREIVVPEPLRARIEAGINARMGEGQVRLGSVRVSVGRDGIPRLTLSNVAIGSASDGAAAILNSLGARLSPGRLLRGELATSGLVLEGAQITIRRTASGAFAFRSGQAGEAEARSIPDLLDLIDETFALPALSSLRTVEANGIVLTLEDARSGRIWQATNATLILRNEEAATTMTLASDVFNGTDDVAEVQVSLARNRVKSGISLGISVKGMPASDIALQSPVLAWLGVLEAPLSGALRTEIDAEGLVTSVAGTLDIEAGALRPSPDVPPVSFQSARTYFTFDPSRQRIDFSDVAVVSEQGSLAASGHTYLADFDGPWPKAFLGQFSASAFEAYGIGMFDGPVALSDMRADLRLKLDPFTVEVGQLTAEENGTVVRATGRVAAEKDGWHVSVDSQAASIGIEQVLAFWPTPAAPITRTWLVRNIRAGSLSNVSAGFRFQTGSKPDGSLSFEFSDGETLFLSSMPPLRQAAGRASLHDSAFHLTLDEARINAGPEGVVDVSGSSFSVPDMNEKPTFGVIDLEASGPLPAALAVLDKPPLRIMERAGRSPNLAQADARARARISLPLKNGIKSDDVLYTVNGTLSGVTSDAVVTGRTLTADRLEFSASPAELRILGALELDDVPVGADWRQPLGAGAADGSRVDGTVAISRETADTFGIPLPAGFITGQGTGMFSLDLRPNAAPLLRITSDLAGLGLAIEGVGWQKEPSSTGDFEVTATLGSVPKVETLALSAQGLALNGTVELGTDGAFQSATFERVRVGEWLDGSVTLTPRGGGGDAAVALTAGRLDLRRLPLRGSGTAGRSPINVSLDTVIVSDGVSLAPFRGTLEQGRAGLSGTFDARVNGVTPVQGTLAPANAGTAVRIRSDNAGGVIRDSGLSPNAQGGTLDLVLTPVVGAPGGTYDGQFLIEGVRLRNAPAMADLLDAISVVGLLDQLRGPGIHFTSVDGSFRLTRDRLTLTEAAAVGGSIGISADGIYDLVAKQMDFRGVISPVYFVNGIGSVLTRRGEGLFGFNYSMTGSVTDPKVGVNPLSILTPGIFRRIFRRAPPGE